MPRIVPTTDVPKAGDKWIKIRNVPGRRAPDTSYYEKGKIIELDYVSRGSDYVIVWIITNGQSITQCMLLRYWERLPE
jgi:hypothetical protein